MSRKTIQIILGALVFTLAVFIMSFSSVQKNKAVIPSPNIEIEVPTGMVFLTKEDILNRLQSKDLIYEGITFEDINIKKIEDELKEMHQMSDVQVYKTLNGELFIEIKLREPVARVFTQEETGFYIDKKGNVMPLSNNYTAPVLVFTGHISHPPVNSSFEIIHNDSLKKNSVIHEIYVISSFISDDSFLSNLITQVYVNEGNEYELIPRVGDYRIFLGDAHNLERKFDNLEILYKQGLKNTGWNDYDSIYLKYNNQIVCSRKE